MLATYADNWTGLYYADQRWYSSAPGRFLSPDPYRGSMDLTKPASLNRYSYSWNDPINNNDPSGLCVIDGQEYPDPCFITSNDEDQEDGNDDGDTRLGRSQNGSRRLARRYLREVRMPRFSMPIRLRHTFLIKRRGVPIAKEI